MQKHIITVLLSFSSVLFVVLSGTIMAYQTNIIPDVEDKFQKAIREKDTISAYVTQLEEELALAKEKQLEMENKLREKLANEERRVLEKNQEEQNARIAAEKKLLLKN